MIRRGWGLAAVVRLLPLLALASIEAYSQFTLEDARMLREGAPFVVRGVVYGNTPIGSPLSATLDASPCLYARDFPLIAGLGANTIRTRARVAPDDRVFRRTLASANLYWVAGFPLAPYAGAGRTLAPTSAEGQALRRRILDDLSAYATAWADEPRLIAFTFGEGEVAGYGQRFAGVPADFFSLLAEAAARLKAEHPGRLVSSVVAPGDIGGFASGASDAQQPNVDFWSIQASGRASAATLFDEVRGRTAKPYLIAGFGVDAYDQRAGAADPAAQAQAAEMLAREIDSALRGGFHRVLGALWADYADEWARGGPNPRVHGVGGVAAPGSPDGWWNAGWSGLFGAAISGAPGLDTLRPRPAYFTLARLWGGRAPADLTLPGPPEVDPLAVANSASGFALLSPGGLLTARGEGLAAAGRAAESPGDLPFHLGAASLCLDSQPVPLFAAAPDELHGQTPWSARPGLASLVAFRGGAASAPVEIDVRPAAPGILPNGVFRPGLPCPVDAANGVPPGSYLEVYGAGLGPGVDPPTTGLAAAAHTPLPAPPRARLGDADIPIVWSGLIPGATGIHQTNVFVPDDAALGDTELRLESSGVLSNARPLRVLSGGDAPYLVLGTPSPTEVVIQEGGPPQTALVSLAGGNGFCDIVRFDLTGLPPGVRASIPVGLPGQTLPLTVRAEPGAPRAERATVTLTAVSTVRERPSQRLRVTVLPGSGDVRLRVVSGGWRSGQPQAAFFFEDREIHRATGGGPGRGFNFVTLDAATGAIGPVRTFDTWDSEDADRALRDFLFALPDGTLTLAAIADDGALKLSAQTRAAIRQRLGSETIDGVRYQWSWAILSRAGAERPMAEGALSAGVVTLERTVSFPLP